MNWVKLYLDAIHRGEEVVSLKVKTVYEREVAWMDNPPADFAFYFSEEAGQRPIEFIERFCKRSDGKHGGECVKLELFQKAKIQLVFGWLEKESNLRRFREVVDIRARKTGKSTETAGVIQYMAFADGEGAAECYCVANKLDQAKKIFDEVINMRAQSPALRAITKKRQSDIYCPINFSFIKALASDTKTMDGLNAHFFVQDEFHEARDSKLYDVMIQSQSSRDQPMAWLISTNGFVREGFFDDKYNYCSKVALWESGFEDYRLLPLIYELDSRDEWDNPDCWAKANPGLGKIKSLKTLKEHVEKAKRDPSFLPTVLTKDFNVPENTSVAWLPYESCVNEKVAPFEYLHHSYAIGGCDLSATTDLTCATLLIRKPNDDNFYVLQKYFLPSLRVNEAESSSAREAPYRLWAEHGWLTICDGARIDFHTVTQWFVDMVNLYDIRPLWIGYDAALSGYWVEEMAGFGFDMEKIRQGPFTWTYPMKELGGLLEEHKIIYQNNPMLRWCLLNTAKKTVNKDGIESIQPAKSGSTKRIDGMVSLLNAYTCYKNHEDEFLRYVR
jgi:phage terminase large subunit-like protein